MKSKITLLAVATVFLSSQAMATPRLQLDFGTDNVEYDSGTDTILTSDSTFTLRSFLNPNEAKQTVAEAAAGTYRVSVALSPQSAPGSVIPSFGSFTVGGNTYDGSSSWLYGTPPAEFHTNGQDLADHGVFETHYLEFGISFDVNNDIDLYNTQERAESADPSIYGTDLLTDAADKMMYVDLEFDVSGLLSPYQLHFDLYEIGLTNNGKEKVVDKAPFSKDAGTNVTVPEPGIIALLGVGLVGIGAARRRRLS